MSEEEKLPQWHQSPRPGEDGEALTPNREAIAEWVAALESGQYEQGEGWLKVIDDKGSAKYCCLGVACEIFSERLDLKVGAESSSGTNWIVFAGMKQFLPKEVLTYLGLFVNEEMDTSVMVLDPNPDAYPAIPAEISVVQMNDDRHNNFTTIAQAIKDTYLREGVTP